MNKYDSRRIAREIEEEVEARRQQIVNMGGDPKSWPETAESVFALLERIAERIRAIGT